MSMFFRNIKSVGPDGIQVDFLYKLRSVLAEPLWLLFRRSIDSGIFPSALNIGSIRPILKSGDSTRMTGCHKLSSNNNFTSFIQIIWNTYP